MIYFIQYGDNGPIKVGSAKDVSARLAELQVGSPEALTVLASIDGGMAEERVVHAMLDAARLRGEWFAPTPDVLSMVQTAAVSPSVLENLISNRWLIQAEGNKAEALAMMVGGKQALARICEISPAIVTRWCKSGIINGKYNTRIKRFLRRWVEGLPVDEDEKLRQLKTALSCLDHIEVCPCCGQPMEGRRAI